VHVSRSACIDPEVKRSKVKGQMRCRRGCASRRLLRLSSRLQQQIRLTTRIVWEWLAWWCFVACRSQDDECNWSSPWRPHLVTAVDETRPCVVRGTTREVEVSAHTSRNPIDLTATLLKKTRQDLDFYRVSQKVPPPPLRHFHILPLAAVLCRRKFIQFLPFISSPMYRFWSTSRKICKNCNIFC